MAPTYEGNKDFEFAQRGLVATPSSAQIYSDSGSEVVWNTDAYNFLQADCPSTANKLLWRQGQLCSATAGLYMVTDGVYQVRGFDIANMSIVRIPSSNGIVIVDCLTSVETARSALDLYMQYHKQQTGQDAAVKALIYTHCHGDHFGGAQAVLDAAAGADVAIIAPDGFLEHAVSENIYAGPAMTRRAIYMYGEALDKSPTGQIGVGLGQILSTGATTLVAPTQTVRADGPLLPAVEGIDIVCQLTPGTEAPAEANFFFPAYAALCMAENATHTLHNIQTLRGAPVRDARLWSRYLDESIALFAAKSTVVFSSHHWPTWNDDGEDLITAFLSEQRDYYAFLHNESLRCLNNGMTPADIAEAIVMPPTLSARTNLVGYYGSVSHNVKAVYDRYMGWFDGNPANLWPHPPAAEATRLVACMGGAAAVLSAAKDYRARGDVRFAATLLNKLVFADASNAAAREELAAVYTSLGQGAENGTWRNIYLTGASELLSAPTPVVTTLSASSLSALNFDELFDVLATRVEGPRAIVQPGVTIEFMVADMAVPGGSRTAAAGWHLRLSNGAVTGRAVAYAAPPSPRDAAVTLTVWLSHAQLVDTVGCAAVCEASPLDAFTTAGDTAAWEVVAGLVQVPDPAFAIVTP